MHSSGLIQTRIFDSRSLGSCYTRTVKKNRNWSIISKQKEVTRFKERKKREEKKIKRMGLDTELSLPKVPFFVYETSSKTTK